MLYYLNYPSWISPEVIPGLPIRWYGLMYLVAFAVAYIMVRLQVRKRGINVSGDDTLNLFFWGIIGLLLGARLLSALLYEPDGTYWRQPWLIFWPFRNGTFVGLQGMSYHGGLIGAIVAGILYCKRHGFNVGEWADIITVSAPLGYTFGRLGNFINAELYGRVTDAPFGMVFPTATRFPANVPWVVEMAENAGITVTDPNMMVNLPRHASQLYESALEGVILWAILWFIVDRYSRYRGVTTASYVIGYGVARFIAEYFRQPDADLGFVLTFSGDPGPIYMLNSFVDFTMGQVLSLMMIAVGVVILITARYVGARNPSLQSYSSKRGGPGASHGIGNRKTGKNR